MSKNIVTESDLEPDTRLPPVQLVEHLLESLDEDQNFDAFDLESAINAFTNFQAPMSNSKISELTCSGSTIVQFLVASKETTGDYKLWTMMSSPMKVRLVHLLNKIFNQGFIRSLFSLRDHIRTLALGSKPRHSVSAMATLPDVLIASVIDYINCDVSNDLPPSSPLRPFSSWSHQTIELVVRIPTDPEQLMNVLSSQIPRNDKLSYEIKLACLSLLYCLCCLDNWSPLQPDQAYDQLASFITSLDENISVSPISVSQILCLYGYLRRYQIHKIQLFKPVTIRKIWILFISLFPSPQNLLADIMLNKAQNTLFSDGGEIMPWVWLHADFCPDVETKWVGCLTTLWVLTHFTPPSLESFTASRPPSKSTLSKASRSNDMGRNSEIITILSNNDGIGLQILLNFFFGLSPPQGLSPSTWNQIWRSIFSILLDLHVGTRNQYKFEHSTVDERLSRLVVEALQRLFENIFDLPQKHHFIRQVIGLPPKYITFFLRKAQKNLHKFLNQTLLVAQQSMETIKTEDTKYLSEATDCLDFLNFWAENQFDVKFVQPLGFVISLLQLISTPSECIDSYKLAASRLLITIESSEGCRWVFNSRDLHLVSETLLEMNEPDGDDLGTVMAEFVRTAIDRFPTYDPQRMFLFHAFRDRLENIVWNTFKQNHSGVLFSSCSKSIEGASGCFPFSGRTEAMKTIAMALVSCFKSLDTLTQTHVRSGPLVKRLLRQISTRPSISHLLKEVEELLSSR